MSRIAACTFALGSIVAVSSASAQDALPPGRVLPVTSTVRNAGVLHLATSTWTRKASSASLGADTIYDNTCRGIYYGPLDDDTFVDEGRLPSPSGPTNFNARPGCATSYRIDGFQIAYCTDRVVPGPFHVGFFQSYAACSTTIGVTPHGSFALAGLPGSPSIGVGACWIVTVDLGAPPEGSAMSFSMAADGDGTYTGLSSANLFGWSIRLTAPPGEGSATGPIAACDLAVCTGYDGTRWDPVVDYTEEGSGMGTLDQFRIEGGSTAPGCYYFSGAPFFSLHLELYADACPLHPAGVDFCSGDGLSTACPCGNASNPGEHGGCLNSLGQSGRLRAEGDPSLTNDTLRLFLAGLPPNAPLVFCQGTARLNNGMGTTFGDGLRCVGGTIVRLGTRAADGSGSAALPSGGSPPLSIVGGVTSPGVRTYQAWYRNAASFCTAATFNLANGWEVTWAP